MFTEPKLIDRKEQPYMGIRTQVPMRQFQKMIPKFVNELLTWLATQGVKPAGGPFMRFHVINMSSNMDVEIGVPVASALPGTGHIAADVLPAGKYAALIYTGVKNGIKANKALLDWAAEQGIVWDRFDSVNGDGFGARYETFLTGPEDDPDQSKWKTEVAIRLADRQPQ